MLYTVRNGLNNAMLEKFDIVSSNEMYGIVKQEDSSCVLPSEYDNIFIYGEDIFILHKKGKIGAVRIENERVWFIAECKFNTLESIGHDLIFCNDKKVRYYNSVLKTVRDFIDVIVDIPFLYCKDEKHQYILYGELGKEIYKKEYTSYSESCFCFCGHTEKGPVFYDARYSTYLYPTEKGYKHYIEFINHPIIINRNNVANITEGESGIGLIDAYGNSIVDNCYDVIKIELKITALNDEKIVNKIIPLSNEMFKKGEITAIENWI